ncbi:MAG: symmetrical bis(5'-nucleosyl)-tetraphosphatase [Burkholderiales bacterium]
MVYLLGDIQGCCNALERLLEKIDFSPSRDQLYVLGDLVNRGPQSLQTLQTLAGLGASAQCLLGNHDLHLLAVAHGVRPAHHNDTLNDILTSPQREHWLRWLTQQRLAIHAHGWLMVHAGVHPAWNLATTLNLAGEVEQQLQSPQLKVFLGMMYGNNPTRWSPQLTGPDRLRFTINALTRMRFVQADGTLDLTSKEGAGQAPAGCTAWYDAPDRASLGQPIAFGHWSTLGLVNRPNLLALDTGCVWGGHLTAVRIDGGRREVIQVNCPQAQQPG